MRADLPKRHVTSSALQGLQLMTSDYITGKAAFYMTLEDFSNSRKCERMVAKIKFPVPFHLLDHIIIPINHFWQDGSENWSPAGHGHTPLRFHFATMWSSTVAIILSTVTSFCFPSTCTITGVSAVSRGCSDVIFAGCTTQEGAGASALVWAVHAIL